MSRVQGSSSSSSSSLKRKHQDLALVSAGSLTEGELTLYSFIHSKKEMPIWTGDMRRGTNLPDSVVKKLLKLLLARNLIKEIVNYKNKNRKHYIASDFEPSKEITGGDWYTEGSFDTGFISNMKRVSLKYISEQNVATSEGVLEYIRRNEVFHVEVTAQRVEEILKTLVLEDEIVEVKSTGFGDFASVPVGRVCYMCKSKGGGVIGKQKIGAMASIPCGVCPRINFCTPGGIVSPTNCVYYQQWFDKYLGF